jgi:hypothetical protein
MKLIVDREKQTLLVSDQLGDGSRVYHLPDDVKIHRIVSAGGEVQEGPLIVRFRPNGSSDNAEIVLQSNTGSLISIISDPITGGARIETGSGGRVR